MTAYLMFTTVLLLLGGIVWSRNSMLNCGLKCILLLGGLWGMLLCLHDLGYIVKVAG